MHEALAFLKGPRKESSYKAQAVRRTFAHQDDGNQAWVIPKKTAKKIQNPGAASIISINNEKTFITESKKEVVRLSQPKQTERRVESLEEV